MSDGVWEDEYFPAEEEPSPEEQAENALALEADFKRWVGNRYRAQYPHLKDPWQWPGGDL